MLSGYKIACFPCSHAKLRTHSNNPESHLKQFQAPSVQVL